jgi:hypothetical protein
MMDEKQGINSFCEQSRRNGLLDFAPEECIPIGQPRRSHSLVLHVPAATSLTSAITIAHPQLAAFHRSNSGISFL